MSTLTLIVPGPCSQSAEGRPHTWQSGPNLLDLGRHGGLLTWANAVDRGWMLGLLLATGG